MPERHPQPRGLDEHRESAIRLQRVVAGDDAIPLEGHRDVGVDVPRRGAGRPVRRTLLTADRPPGEGGTVEVEFRGALPGQVQGRRPPAQRVGGRVRQRCRSAPAARIPRCPRRRGRRSRCRSAPCRRSPGVRRGRWPAAGGRARTAPPAGRSGSPSTSTSALSQKSSRIFALRVAAGPASRCSGRRAARRPPGRATRAGSAGSTSRRRGT